MWNTCNWRLEVGRHRLKAQSECSGCRSEERLRKNRLIASELNLDLNLLLRLRPHTSPLQPPTILPLGLNLSLNLSPEACDVDLVDYH
jgi:hypothetical protein